MSVRQWIRHILETPEERIERLGVEFRARMYENPGKETEESLRRAVADLRKHGYLQEDVDLPKAA